MDELGLATRDTGDLVVSMAIALDIATTFISLYCPLPVSHFPTAATWASWGLILIFTLLGQDYDRQ